MNSNHVPNNQDKVANRINALGLTGVEAVGDDGSVCIQVSGSRQRVAEVAELLSNNPTINVSRVGDGAQEGTLWVNANDCNFHDELHHALA